jgi:signal transduction histidine kinase
VLVWLGANILDQDRVVERQRQEKNLELAAGRFALAIERRLTEIEEQLGRGLGIRFTASGIEAGPEFSPLYQPLPFNTIGPSPDFSEAEDAEFQRHDLHAAAASYRRFAESPEPAVRGMALLRLGAVLREAKDTEGALRAYDDLNRLGSVPIAGEPAAFRARMARLKILKESHKSDDLRREASDFAQALYAGGWAIDRSAFENYREALHASGIAQAEPENEKLAMTEAALDLWRQWREGALPSRRRRLFTEAEPHTLALWVGSSDESTIWLAASGAIEAMMRDIATPQHLSASAVELSRQALAESPVINGITLAPVETRLPFTLRVAATGNIDPIETGWDRRSVLVMGLALAFTVMAIAAYGLYHVTRRELALASQQSDFVSAVSHEFRSPLTSMRHLTDLLVSRSIRSQERMEEYFGALAHETERLHRIVESLLSFGRIESGAYAFHLAEEDVSALLRNVVEQFQREPLAEGREVTCDIEEPLVAARVDRETLTRAVWNLLENAAKYSEAGTPIRVRGRRDNGSLLLSVDDKGVGIPPAERKTIFHKFVRGADAKRAGIRGVGIGLALVQRIVEAHGGSVQLESEPGRGSTFTLVIPCLES